MSDEIKIDFDYYTNSVIADKLRESHNTFVTQVNTAVSQFKEANMTKREVYTMAALVGLSQMAVHGWGMERIANESVELAKHLEEKLR